MMSNSQHASSGRCGVKSSRLGNRVCLFLVLAATLVAYSNNFTAEFVYDDYPFIVENASIRSLSNPARFFYDRASFSDKGAYVIYRPLAALSFAANYAVAGYRPASYHAVNIILHAICGLLVYLFFFDLFRHRIYALFVALLFVLHPVQTEAVSWISARGNPMFLVFLLLSLICYRRWTLHSARRPLLYSLALTFSLLSLLAKEMAVVLPVLLLILDITINRPEAKEQWKQRFMAIIPFFALSGLYVLVRHLVLGETKQMEYWGGSFSASALSMVKAFAYYVRLMFMPRPLMVEYVVPISRSILQPPVLISLAILLAIGILWLFSYRRLPLIAFGISWFFASLIPVSNIIPLQAIMNERFLYLPSIGFCAILASPVLLVRREGKSFLYKAGILALFFICVGYAVLTYSRNRDWRNSLSLWTASVEASPAGTTSQYNLGLELFRRGRYDEAIEHLKIACLFQEHFPSAHGVLGNIYLAQGKIDAAIREYEIGLNQAPHDERLLHNLALAWFEKGKRHSERQEYAQAVRSFLKCLQYEPNFAPAKKELQLVESISRDKASAGSYP
jgi:tetratricopeptide (TPR) repeat protein